MSTYLLIVSGAGADEAHTGLNAHWMQLNNYTALHLAAACGNAGIIDALLQAGADINVECLQRVHPFPSQNGGWLPFLTRSGEFASACRGRAPSIHPTWPCVFQRVFGPNFGQS